MLIELFQQRKLGIIPTDTIYGFSCHWQDEVNIRKIFMIKKRSTSKPLLILVASLEQLSIFIDLTPPIADYLHHLNQPTTIIFPIKKTFKSAFWKKTIAIRFVFWKWLQELLLATGPIVSTSCNMNNQPPIVNFDQLLQFISVVDFIFQKEAQSTQPSRLIDWKTKHQIR